MITGSTASRCDLEGILADPSQAVHLIGLGGIGMAGVAFHLAHRGFPVTGSDAQSSRVTDWLHQSGIDVSLGHDKGNLAPSATWVIRTPAVPDDNPELQAALERSLPVFTRGVVLPELLPGFRSVAVSGTHGKTTTAAMITTLLRQAGRDPSHCIGGEIPHLDGLAHVGKGSEFVVEADESDGTVVHYRPRLAVITNIEFDHMEHFADAAAFERCFEVFAASASERVIYWRDDPVAHRLLELHDHGLSFGRHPDSDVRLLDLRLEPRGTEVWLEFPNNQKVTVTVPVPGRHNAWNAVAACAAGYGLGLSPDQLGSGLSGFQPARRRFEVMLDSEELTVVSDYAHHPTEVRALLETAAGLGKRRLFVVFQPHRYTRTLALRAQFPSALERADSLILAPVYAASESPVDGGTSADLLEEMPLVQRNRTVLADSLDDAWGHMVRRAQPGDLLVIVGAGDVEALAFRAVKHWG